MLNRFIAKLVLNCAVNFIGKLWKDCIEVLGEREVTYHPDMVSVEFDLGAKGVVSLYHLEKYKEVVNFELFGMTHIVYGRVH